MMENKKTVNASGQESFTRIITAEKDKTVSATAFEGPIEGFAQRHLHAADGTAPAALPVREVSFSNSRPGRILSESQNRGFLLQL